MDTLHHMEDKYLDVYLGQFCPREELGELQNTKHNSYFVDDKGFGFDLKAFCDYKSRPRVGLFHQVFDETGNNFVSKWYYTVTGKNAPEKLRENGDFTLFRTEIESKWFLFKSQEKTRVLLPEVSRAYDISNDPQRPERCRIVEKYGDPEAGDWNNAVAVPVFSGEKEASKLWFSTDRVQRSKLVIIKADTAADSYICYYDSAEEKLVKRAKLSELRQDRDYCVLKDFPYILLQHKMYYTFSYEQEFLNVFKEQCEAESFCFDKKDLWNFHTSVKSGYLTILSGMSGTGKSSIVRMYAKALGENCKLTFIPVSPSWTSDTDLLGWYDPQNKKYHCSTELVDILLEAEEAERAKKEGKENANKDCLYLICLDEINLARVEHYFSQFLSALEQPVGTDRKIILYHSKKSENKADAKNAEGNQYPSSISIGENVRFLGTMNVDDTTYGFADKVRDRSNIIQLTVNDYSKGFFKTNTTASEVEPSTNEAAIECNFDFFSFVKGYVDLSDAQEAKLCKFLWTLHDFMNGKASCFGVSPRTVRAIGTYLANYPENDRKDINMEALDYAVNQRVFTKLHGSEYLLKPLFEKNTDKEGIKKDTNNEKPEVVIDVLAGYAGKKTFKHEDPEFKISRKTIEEKKKELKIYGFCP